MSKKAGIKSRLVLLFLLLGLKMTLSGYTVCMNDLVRTYPPNSNSKTPPNTSSLSYIFSFYDEFISPIDGDRCQMSPSCSHYSRQAISKRGFVTGLLMTLDRLQRCGYDLARYPRIYQNNVERYLDPVNPSGRRDGQEP